MATPKPLTQRRAGVAALAMSLLITACAGTGTDDELAATEAEPASLVELAETSPTSDEADPALFDSSQVHEIDITFDPDDYAEMIDEFSSTGDKEWIEATVVIDGQTYTDAGIRLKGNSSLFGLNAQTATNPEDLPWLIRLDKYIDFQNHQGYYDLVIRSSSTETAMNEAVALELLEEAGLATQQAIATSFTVNGGETELRLAIEHPDEAWTEAAFGDDDGLLYKADSEGDYSYRGDDADAYDDVFDQKAGDDDLDPLIDFLEFINNADDATFAAELSDRLDVDAFATYLAFQDLVGNADDINGRGNNSYLYFDPDTGLMTVVAWDHNLAFNTANVGGATGPGGRGGPPVGVVGDPGVGGPGDQANVLVDRFMAVDEFANLYETRFVGLTDQLYTSGTVDQVIDTWTDVLVDGATELVPAATVTAEASAIVSSVEAQR